MNSGTGLKHIAAALLIWLGGLAQLAVADVCVYKPPKVRRVCGTVVDQQGLPIPSVAVTLFQNADAIKHLSTDDAGEFDFGTLPSGEYQIDVAAIGFPSGRYKLTLAKPAQSCAKALQIEMAVGSIHCGGDIRETNKPLPTKH